MGKKDVIRASDFNFLMVLGKGSFGKVRSVEVIHAVSLV
jgi:classical protein kinase C